MSKDYKEKLVFGEIRQKNDPELFEKFGIKETPTILALTDPHAYAGEPYDSSELKIDQLKKFMSTYAYREVKIEKKIQMQKLNYTSNKSPASGVCGKRTSNYCLILFLKVKGSEIQYNELLNSFKNDPVTFSYVYSDEESDLMQQFGIDLDYGAVIYKPKRAKFVKMSEQKMQENQNKISLINPATLKAFLDEAISGGSSDGWQKIEPKTAELKLVEMPLGGGKSRSNKDDL